MWKNNIIKKLKSLFSAVSAKHTSAEITSYRDWRIIVAGFFTAFIFSLGFNIYMLFQINNDNFFTVAPQTYSVHTLDRDGLGNVLAALAAKDAFLASSTVPKISAVDPSR